MAGFWKWLKSLFGPEPEPEPIVRARPIVLNPGEVQRLTHAAWRIEAIRQHIEQARKISPQRMREFFTETVAHADTLLRADQIDEAQHDAMIKFVRR